jgi:VWFA-related protein
MLTARMPSHAASVATMQTRRFHDSLFSAGCKLFALAVCLLSAAPVLAQAPDSIETIRVDSDLVDLKVSVVSLDPQKQSPELQQKDFLVLEDGKPQEIAFFATADSPFDLVLLLDLSASTKDKLKLIRRSAKRFVDATRPTDRVAVLSFTRSVQVVCPLTLDRSKLKDAIDDIEEPEGGTNFWDALRYVLAILRASASPLRRSAVVVMTDGVDNALPDVAGDGSETTFDELLSVIRNSETMVFPIYLDTEEQEVKRHPHLAPRASYAIARNQLALIAETCGTHGYRAAKLEDLENVYQQVIGDLSRVYSLGYKPSNSTRDGRWRSVTVQIVDRQDVAARTRSGYYAKTVTY